MEGRPQPRPTNHPRRVWETCKLCGQRFSCDLEKLVELSEAGEIVCPNCSPSLHGRFG